MDLKSLTPTQKIELGQMLKQKPKEELARFLASLSPKERDEILYDTHLWLRPNQYIDDSDPSKPVILLQTGRGFGKAICDSEKILTENGWSTMGELKVGDRVYGDDGELTTVVDVYKPEVKVEYLVKFKNGTEKYVCEDHLWKVLDKNGNSKVISTKELPDKDYKNLGVPLTAPLNLNPCEKERQALSLQHIGHFTCLKPDTYKVTIKHPHLLRETVFTLRSLGRNVAILSDDTIYVETHPVMNAFASIEPVTTGENYTCISVDNQSKLYLVGEDLCVTHNTFTGSRWLKSKVEQGHTRLGISAPTMADIRQTCLYGESGLFSAYSPNDPNRPTFITSQSVVKWPNGAVCELIPAESPERARGFNASALWVDEAGSLKNSLNFFNDLSFGVRLGESRILLTTTPRANELIIDLFHRKDKDVKLISGSTFDNADNLSPAMIQRAKDVLGTSLGRQEIMGELILENAGALWSNDLIEECSVYSNEYPPKVWAEACIGVDPAGTSSKRSDLTGIIVAVKMTCGTVVVMEDSSGQYTSEGWSKAILELHEKYSSVVPTKVVVENNGAGAYVKDILLRDNRYLPVKDFPSTTKKFVRAMAISHLYETGHVKMVKDSNLGDLQTEMVVWEGSSKFSPDRIDAHVFAVQELIGRTNEYVTVKNFLI